MSPLDGFKRLIDSHTEMSSARQQPAAPFPAVPSTLNAHDYELRDRNSDYDTSSNTDPYYTPYLGLRARLSQVWINRWTILILLVLVRLLLSISSINNEIANAKTSALSACTSVEKVGSAMASMPHYLSEGVNALAADGVTKAVDALMSMLLLTVTGVEEIVLFYINMLTSTYVCLITFAVTGSLHAAIKMIEEVGDLMNKSISGITGEMSKDLSSFQDDLNTFLKALTSVTSVFGGSKTPPKIDLTTQINELNSIRIDPTALDADLTKLNASIPTFAEVQNFTNSVIRLPFEEIKKLINESVGGYTFDKSVFPLAEKQTMTFCTDNSKISDFFDGLVDTVYTAKKIFLGVLIALAVLACVPMTIIEIRRWNKMRERSVMIQKKAYDPMDVIYIASRPYTAGAGLAMSSKFKSTKRQILTRWFVAYATSLPALVVLALGLAGLFSCLCQYITLKAIEKEVPALASQVGDFAGTVVYALNNASEKWAVDANNVISSTNTKVNEDVFGWVNTSTTAINNTLNTFSNEMTKALNATFGGTILYDPITEVMNCLIGLKIAGIEKGLTWVHDNAHVTFPEFRKDVFSLGAAASLTNSSSDPTASFLSSPGSVASDDITNAVAKVVVKLQDGIRQEAIIAACVVLIWVFIMLIGLGYACFGMLGRDKTRAEGGPVGYTGDHRTRSPRQYDNSQFDAFGGPVNSVHQKHSADEVAFASGGGEDEKYGHVGHHRSVDASIRPGHDRTSSYGYLEKR